MLEEKNETSHARFKIPQGKGVRGGSMGGQVDGSDLVKPKNNASLEKTGPQHSSKVTPQFKTGGASVKK